LVPPLKRKGFFDMKRCFGLLEYDQKQRELKNSFNMYNPKLNTSKLKSNKLKTDVKLRKDNVAGY
jgi:hypothetical protein